MTEPTEGLLPDAGDAYARIALLQDIFLFKPFIFTWPTECFLPETGSTRNKNGLD